MIRARRWRALRTLHYLHAPLLLLMSSPRFALCRLGGHSYLPGFQPVQIRVSPTSLQTLMGFLANCTDFRIQNGLSI
ncbi:hypothetical protein B0H10DRAFT_2093762, partial [Mycena sp. CBHHK59/15]